MTSDSNERLLAKVKEAEAEDLYKRELEKEKRLKTTIFDDGEDVIIITSTEY